MNKKTRQKIHQKKFVIWFIAVALSILAIFVGNRIATKDFSLFSVSAEETVKGKVIAVLDRSIDEIPVGETESYTSTNITFTAKIKNGLYKDQVVTVQQLIDSMFAGSEFIKEVEPGDNIMLLKMDDPNTDVTPWQFVDYYRFDKIVILGLIFAGLVLLIGRWKGINTLLSLTFTFLFVFFVFVPSVMNGYNTYISAVITCLYTITMTLVLINGASKKTLATMIGCISGTIIAAVTTTIMSRILHLTGFVDEHSIYLTMLNPDKPIELTAIIFAAIIIGAMGAIMDVAMDISSALFELCEHAPNITFQKLFKSGMSIGRDIMGTMANTLVLAYIGSSLTTIMLLLTYSDSLLHLLNREIIIVELLQALIGSSAIILTIPLTVITCGFLYIRSNESNKKPVSTS
ncbi:YibE/F family protein [Desulfotomaculum sp. 1211_IL3151]|uniref:YibE/F family protein n=1 Tax=Desulfotomaculum sp. 1211_IL3151 TaxID=3084055 RepID=UPI002FDA7BDB